MDIDLATRICHDGIRRPVDEVDPDAPPVSKSALAAVTTPPVNGILTVTRTTTGGAVTPTFDGVGGGSSFALVAATTSTQLKAGLVNSLPNVATADFDVSGSDGGPFTVAAADDGAWAGQELPELSFAGGTGGTVTVEVDEPGRGALDGPEAVVVKLGQHEDRLDALEA